MLRLRRGKQNLNLLKVKVMFGKKRESFALLAEGREQVSLSVELGQVRTLEEYPAGAGSDGGSRQWGMTRME